MNPPGPLYLAGDIGATNIRLALTSMGEERVVVHAAVRWPGGEIANLDDALRRFLAGRPFAEAALRRACLGVAGPIDGRRASFTNRGWRIDADELEAWIGAPVDLVNDLEAAASGIDALEPPDRVVLQAGSPATHGTRLLIAAGTGLGVAHAIWQGNGYRALPSEGGHAGFAPQTAGQWRLAEALRREHGRVEAEHVLSGDGLVRIYEVLRRDDPSTETPALRAALQRGDGATAISRFGLQDADPLARAALELFVECYGTVAGDHALTTLPRGGVHIGGGIAPKIFAKLAAGGFLRAFNGKGAFGALTESFPVVVITNDQLGLLGATCIARRRARDDA